GRRSLSRSEFRPPSSQARHTPWNSVSGVDYKGASTPSRPPSRSQSRAGARTPNGMYGTNPRTRPQTPSHIPAPVSYFNLARSPSRAASESDLDDMEFPTSLMQRAFTPSADRGFATPDPGRKRRPSNSLIPVPTLNITSNSRPGTALSMNDHRSGSPSQDGHGRRSPRESPSAWKEGSVFKESPSNPYKDSSPSAGRAGARSQTPEAMLRSRAMQTPVYLDNSSPNEKNATPSGRPRASAPSSFKGDGKTLVFGPGGSGNPNEGGRGPSRPTSRSANYGFGRMTPGLDGPGPTYIPAKTDELDVEVANVVNGMPHGFL
ncbi:17303_t:CDS:1, partial [Acaulospora colombiana]